MMSVIILTVVPVGVAWIIKSQSNEQILTLQWRYYERDGVSN